MSIRICTADELQDDDLIAWEHIGGVIQGKVRERVSSRKDMGHVPLFQLEEFAAGMGLRYDNYVVGPGDENPVPNGKVLIFGPFSMPGLTHHYAFLKSDQLVAVFNP